MKLKDFLKRFEGLDPEAEIHAISSAISFEKSIDKNQGDTITFLHGNGEAVLISTIGLCGAIENQLGSAAIDVLFGAIKSCRKK